MTAEQKTAAMQRARWNARENAAPTEVPSTTRVIAVASGKGGVGKSSVTVNLAAALASRGLTVGVLDADIWGFSVPRMLGVDGRLGGTDGKITPNTLERPERRRRRATPGVLKVVSMGFLVDDEGTALMWRGLILTKALEQFLTDVRWGEMDYLLIDMPPGTGDIQMGLARMLPQAEMLVVTTPALAAQKVAVRVADMARRSYVKVVGRRREHERVRARRRIPPRGVRARRRRRARRRDRRAARGADPARARGVGGWRHRHTDRAEHAREPGRRRVPEPRRPHRRPTCCRPIEMSGCTARIFDLMLRPRRRRRVTGPGVTPGPVRTASTRALLDRELGEDLLASVQSSSVSLTNT